MSRLIAGSSLLVTLLLLSPPAQAAEEIQLHYKMANDHPLVYRIETSVKQTQLVGGGPVENEFSHREIVQRSLDKLDDNGGFRVRSESKQLQVNIKLGPVGEYQFDSKSDKRDEGGVLSNALNPVYERLKNAAITFTMSPRGEISATEGLKELLQDVLKENPIAVQLTGGGNEKSTEMSLAEMFVVFSEKPVKPGDTWEAKYQLEIPNIGKADGTRRFTYESPDTVAGRKTVRIRMTHDLAFDVDLVNGGAKVKGKMKIDQSSGIIHFDPEKGQIVSLDSTYKLSGDMNIDAGGKLIPLKSDQEQHVKLELLDKLPE